MSEKDLNESWYWLIALCAACGGLTAQIIMNLIDHLFLTPFLVVTTCYLVGKSLGDWYNERVKDAQINLEDD